MTEDDLRNFEEACTDPDNYQLTIRDLGPKLLAEVRNLRRELMRAANLFVLEYPKNPPPAFIEEVGDSYRITMAAAPFRIRMLSQDEAVAYEREACAKLVESFEQPPHAGPLSADLRELDCQVEEIAAAIRSRK